MKQVEAMKQALKALENTMCISQHNEITEAITALRAAIEQAEKAEPFGYIFSDRFLKEPPRPDLKEYRSPLYTHPSQPPEGWHPTDLQIIQIADSIPTVASYDWDADDVLLFAKRLLAAAPKEKS